MRLFWMTVPQPLTGPVRQCRSHFIVAGLFSALVNLLYLAPTIYMMQVYDRVVPTGGVLTLFWITAVVAIAIATLAGLDAMRSRLLMRASLRLNRLLGAEILDRLMARGRGDRSTLSTTQAMREFDILRQALGGPATMALLDAPWTPLYLLVAFVIHPLLGVLVLAGGCVLVLLALANERETRARGREAHVAQAAAYAEQEVAVGHSEVIRALGMRHAFVNRQVEKRHAGVEAGLSMHLVGSRYQSLIKFCRMFMQSLALGAGAWLAINGEVSVGAIIAASVLLSRALAPIEQLVGAWPTLVQARVAIQTLEALFHNTEGAVAPRTRLADPQGQLELDRVVARSEDGAAIILRNISFRLVPGEVLGVIGPSGAGKTTLARIASGARPPDLGEIRIDGANMADWDPERLAPHIGYLPQSVSLLPGSVAENISRFALERGVPKALVDPEVVAAARAAGTHEMILRLPDGYETLIGDGGHQLSAGQAQRIALARALYGKPRLIVLDEPNSALDADGEEALGQAVMAAKADGAAVLIIAHRASILSSADRLLVLRDGSIAELGPREEVLDILRAQAARPKVVPIKERVQS